MSWRSSNILNLHVDVSLRNCSGFFLLTVDKLCDVNPVEICHCAIDDR